MNIGDISRKNVSSVSMFLFLFLYAEFNKIMQCLLLYDFFLCTRQLPPECT